MCRSFIIGLPPKPPVGNSRSRSHRVRPWRRDVEVGVPALAVLQRVGVGHQVAAHPVGVDQLVTRAVLLTSSSWVVEMSWIQRIGSYGIRSARKISS